MSKDFLTKKFRAFDDGVMIYQDMVSSKNDPYKQLSEFFDKIREDSIVMQFVGNQDKTKRDIYEDDIIKIQLPAGGFWGNIKVEKIGIVRYEPDRGAFIVEWDWSKNQHHVVLNCDIAWTAEILGNRYENPELFK